jgi:hypothetical protein
MKRINLTQGQFTWVDNEDYEYLMQWKWCAQSNHRGKFYVRRSCLVSEDTGKASISMHRAIMNRQGFDPKIIDHIDRNPLNNRRNNLREVDYSMNSHNREKASNKTSKYVGVSKLRQGVFTVLMSHNKKGKVYWDV